MIWMEKTVFHNHLLPLARTIDNKRKWEPLVRVSSIDVSFLNSFFYLFRHVCEGTWFHAAVVNLSERVSSRDFYCLWSLMSYSVRGNPVCLFGKGEGLQSSYDSLIQQHPSNGETNLVADILSQRLMVIRAATVLIFPSALIFQELV